MATSTFKVDPTIDPIIPKATTTNTGHYFLGVQAIKRLCVEQNTVAWQQLKPELFKVNEKDVFEWVSDHFKMHHALPQVDTLIQYYPDCFVLDVIEPSSFYLKRLDDRYKYDLLSKAMIDSSKVLKDDQENHEEALNILRDAVNELEKQGASVEAAKVNYAPTEVPRLEVTPDPSDVIDQLALTMTQGTMAPFNFARETVKMMLLAALPANKPKVSWNDRLHSRQYVVIISDYAESGKGTTYNRAKEVMEYAADPGSVGPVEIIQGSLLGSPEYTAKELSAYTNPGGTVIYYDEGKVMSQKDATGRGNGGLMTMYTQLFDSNEYGSGSHKNGKYHLVDANVSLLMHFVKGGFDQSFMGSGATKDGFLSRCTLVYDHKNAVEDGAEWPDWEKQKMKCFHLMLKAKDCFGRTEIIESPLVKAKRLECVKKIRSFDSAYRARLEFLFYQDLYCRAMFSDGVVTVEKVERSMAWADHQLRSRQILWPDDFSVNKDERMENNLRKAYEKYRELTHAQAKRLCHTTRPGTGGDQAYNRAHKALLASRAIEQVRLNHKQHPVFEWQEEQ